jgi:hypothetical protein
MEIISTMMITACCLSIMGSSLMVFMYLRLGVRNNLALKLICYMSISDLIFSLGNIMYVDPGTSLPSLRVRTPGGTNA